MSRLQVFKRHFHASVILYKFKPPNLPPMLEKIMKKGMKKKWDKPANATPPGIGGKITENSKRRAQFLGPMLYNHIKDFLYSGELEELDDNMALAEVEILRVKVTPDLSTAHVHWKATGTDVDNEMQKILTKTSSRIRHFLATYQFLSKVPNIVFVKDLSHAKHMEMLELLQKADMGDDYRWSEMDDNLGTLPAFDNKITKEKTSDISMIGQRFASEFNTDVVYMGSHTDATCFGVNQYNESQSSGNTNTQPLDITFHNDLYGIQHDVLMKKLITSKQKKKKRNIEINNSTLTENLMLDLSSNTKPREGISKHLRLLQRKKSENPKQEVDYFNLPSKPLSSRDISMSNIRFNGQDDDDIINETEQTENDLDYSDGELDEQHIFDKEIDEKYISEWVSDDELDKGSHKSGSSTEGTDDRYIDELTSSDEEIDEKYIDELSSSDEESDESSSSDEETDTEKNSPDKK